MVHYNLCFASTTSAISIYTSIYCFHHLLTTSSHVPRPSFLRTSLTASFNHPTPVTKSSSGSTTLLLTTTDLTPLHSFVHAPFLPIISTTSPEHPLTSNHFKHNDFFATARTAPGFANASHPAKLRCVILGVSSSSCSKTFKSCFLGAASERCVSAPNRTADAGATSQDSGSGTGSSGVGGRNTGSRAAMLACGRSRCVTSSVPSEKRSENAAGVRWE